jgi:hypothetical protein
MVSAALMRGSRSPRVVHRQEHGQPAEREAARADARGVDRAGQLLEQAIEHEAQVGRLLGRVLERGAAGRAAARERVVGRGHEVAMARQVLAEPALAEAAVHEAVAVQDERTRRTLERRRVAADFGRRIPELDGERAIGRALEVAVRPCGSRLVDEPEGAEADRLRSGGGVVR